MTTWQMLIERLLKQASSAMSTQVATSSKKKAVGIEKDPF
jgi:hypothetical protein